jgi:hypothetical protein
MKFIALSFIFSIFAFSIWAEESAGNILSDRQKQLKEARKKYFDEIEKINKAALEKLGHQLRNSIIKKDFAEAQKIKEAISQILENKKANETPGAPASDNNNKTIATTTKKSGILKSTIDENYPEGTFRQFGHHYHQLPFKMNRIDAEKICKDLGGHLLSIDNEEEYKFFHDYSVKKKKPLWLDIFKKNNEWSNWKGEKAKFIKWFDGKYEIWPDSDYVAINVNESKSDMVRMRGTKFSNYVICEWDK